MNKLFVRERLWRHVPTLDELRADSNPDNSVLVESREGKSYAAAINAIGAFVYPFSSLPNTKNNSVLRIRFYFAQDDDGNVIYPSNAPELNALHR